MKNREPWWEDWMVWCYLTIMLCLVLSSIETCKRTEHEYRMKELEFQRGVSK